MREEVDEGESPNCGLIESDDNTIGSGTKHEDVCVAITPAVATFQATKGYGDVEGRMLHLILSLSLTLHNL